MPTAGEARAKKKHTNERSMQVKIRNARTLTKKQGKENVKPHAGKAKPAPDFSKLHDKWNTKFQTGKAFAKKTNTKVDPFVLTAVISHNILSSKIRDSSDTENTEEDFGFEIDNNALQGILNNNGIQVQQENHLQTYNTNGETRQSAPNTIMGGSTKRTSIYYTGTKNKSSTQPQPLQTKGLSSKRPVFGFEAKLGKKQVVWADQDDDEEISFKPDASALESILNNKGIDERHTLGARHTMASTRTVPYLQYYKRQSAIENQQSKRTSIYYTGSKSTKGVGSGLTRPSLIGRPRSSVLEQATVPKKQEYVPGSTVVGRQDEENEKKDFQVNTFVKPSTPGHRETSSSLVSKNTDTKPCIRLNTLMTPSRGQLAIRPQAPTGHTASSKKQVTWSDILTPHRGMDHAKETKITASKEQTNLISSLKRSHFGDSSPWSVTKHTVSSTHAESPVDADTIALKLFSDEDTHTISQENEKEKLELEELERQAIEELKLLEVEENGISKKYCNGFDSVRKTTASIDISGCEPLVSPLEVVGTPRNVKRTDTTEQMLSATPQNHMRVTTRNKTPIASRLVRHQSRGATTGLLDPLCTALTASPCLFVCQDNVRSGFQAQVGYTAPKTSPFVSYTGQGLSGGVHSIMRSAPFTPTQHIAQTPMTNAPLDTGQFTFGLPSSIKKSLGSKRPYSSSVASNPLPHKSLSLANTFCSSTPSIEVPASSFQGYSTTTKKEYPNYSGLSQNGFADNAYQPVDNPTTSDLAAEKPLTTSIHGNHCYGPIKKPSTSIHGNNFYEPVKKPSMSIHSNSFYEAAEQPLSGIHESSSQGFNSSNRFQSRVSQNDNVSYSGHTQQSNTICRDLRSSKTNSVTMMAPGHIAMNGLALNKSAYTNCPINGEESTMSTHSPALILQQARPCSITNLNYNLDRVSLRSGALEVACGNRSKQINSVDFPSSSRVPTSTNDSLSLRSAVGQLGFQRVEKTRIIREVATTVLGTREEKTESRFTPSQNKRVGVCLPRSIETHSTLAEEALLDTEVALYSTLGARIKKRCMRDLSNPLATILDEGDSQHIVPICVCSDRIYCSVHPVPQSLFV